MGDNHRAISEKLALQRVTLLPPTADLESKRILRQCIAARSALEGLRQIGRIIPNQSVLINAIPLLESKVSSEIENIVTTSDQLFEFSQNQEAADPATKETLRYRTALRQGYEQLRSCPLGTRLAVDVCRTIRGLEIDIRTKPVALGNREAGEIIYTPPQGQELLRNLLANWEEFVHTPSEVDPLVRLAVMHYQFEAIHPFDDGNGRTGRLLNILFLVQEGLLDIPVLFLSRYFLDHRADYYSLLRRVTENGDWEPWVVFILKAVESTANWTSAKIEAIQRLLAHTKSHLKSTLPKVYSHELIDCIFEQPYCRTGNLVERGIAKRQTASKYLTQLEACGVGQVVKIGRENIFLHPKFMKLLTGESNEFEPYGE